MERVSQSESSVAWQMRGRASGVERMRVASMASRRTVGSGSRKAERRILRGAGGEQRGRRGIGWRERDHGVGIGRVRRRVEFVKFVGLRRRRVRVGRQGG